MKKACIIVLTMFFCLILIDSAFATYANYDEVKTSDETTKTSEDIVYPDKAAYISGTIQILLPCANWRIESRDSNVKIWVWVFNVPNRGYWRLVARGEEVSMKNAIVRISADKDDPCFIEIYYLNSLEQEAANWAGLELGIEDMDFFARKEFKNDTLLKGKNFSYELVFGSENVITSVGSMAQYIISSLISDKELCGFIIADARGFLVEVIEFDQRKIKTDIIHKKKILNKLDGIMVRDDQFFIAIYKNH